jgi:hypothetical protein
MSGTENAVNGVPAAGRMPADGNQASPFALRQCDEAMPAEKLIPLG